MLVIWLYPYAKIYTIFFTQLWVGGISLLCVFFHSSYMFMSLNSLQMASCHFLQDALLVHWTSGAHPFLASHLLLPWISQCCLLDNFLILSFYEACSCFIARILMALIVVLGATSPSSWRSFSKRFSSFSLLLSLLELPTTL